MSKTAYYNGVIYTAWDQMQEATAFVVEDGRFTFVGRDEELPDCPNKVDLKGKCVIPGLVDSHCHIVAGVTQRVSSMIFVDEEVTPEKLGKVLVDLIKENELGEDQTVVAMGIDLTLGEFSAQSIDGEISDRPVVVFSYDGHGLLLNTRAMEKLGINRETEDPGRDSYYARDELGNPTGLVIEIPAMRPCKELLSEPTEEEYKEILPDLVMGYGAYGYTAAFDAMSGYDRENKILEVISQLDREGQLKLHLSTSFGYNGEEYIEAREVLKIMKKNREDYTSENLRCSTMKIILDGTLEERSALLYEPYSDDERNFGLENIPFEEVNNAVNLAAEAGFDIHIHAIGDRAVGKAIDALTSIENAGITKTIAHNQVYSDKDAERMAKAGDIFFQTTPQWMLGDEHTLSCLGESRFAKQFPVGTMERAGVRVTFGSDSCLEPKTANPFAGMYVACTRGEESVWGEENLPPAEEKISRMEALYAYSINGAMQLSMDQEIGSICPGKAADFAVLDRDIIRCSLEELGSTQVLKTFFRGCEVFSV